jgi:arylsulfatase A-like enzyme
VNLATFRRLWRGRSLVIATTVALSVAHPYNLSTAVEPRPPNILLIITDDQRIGTMGVMDDTRKWFRDEGVEFKPGIVTTPLCAPSRASIYSGRYTHNHGVLTNLMSDHLDFDHTVQRYLSEAGYRTGLTGKFLNVWPADHDPPYFDYRVVSAGFPYYGGTWNDNGEKRYVGEYSTSFIARRAAAFIEESADDDRPWFLVVSTIAPHGPAVPEHKYAAAGVPRWRGNPAVFERNLSDKPPYVSKRERGRKSLQRGARSRARDLRALLSVDDLVAQIHSLLGELGLIDQTLAFYMSDHGILQGEHGYAGKNVPYRPAIEVPFFMSWPGRVGSGNDNRMAANIDIAPTILDAAGIEPSPDVPMDGRSLLRSWAREEILTEAHQHRWPSPSWASVRARSRQYVEYYDDDTGAVLFREYYDLKKDPWQLHNLLGGDDRTDEPDTAGLERRLDRYRSCTGRACP